MDHRARAIEFGVRLFVCVWFFFVCLNNSNNLFFSRPEPPPIENCSECVMSGYVYVVYLNPILSVCYSESHFVMVLSVRF